jgi:hypothetical protein
MQDYMATAAQRGLNIADMPFTAYDPTQRVAALNPTQNSAINMIQQRATVGSPLMRQAQGEIGKTMGGGYLNSNPYMGTINNIANGGGLQGNPYIDSIINRNANDVQARMGQLGVGSGSFGNSGVQATAARELSDSANQLRYQNYNDARGQQMQALGMGSNIYDQERARQMGAIGAAPGMAQSDYWDANQLLGAGQLQYGQEQAVRDANYQEFAQGREWPFKTQQAFVGSLGMNPGQTSTQQYPDPSKWATGLGGAATGAWTAKTIWDLFNK